MTRRNSPPLSDAEEVVAVTRIRVEHLTEALTVQPIDRGTYAELAAFLEGPAWRACDALDELRGLSAAVARERIVRVLACTPHAVTHEGTRPARFPRSAS